jgi:hypothetical protein
MCHLLQLASVLTVVAWMFLSIAGSAQTRALPSPDLAGILSGLAERTQRYYDRFISIICTESVHQQDLRFNLTPRGKPRMTVYELSVTRDPQSNADGDFRVERTLQSVNGRPARKNQQPGCTDPKTGTPEPLGFLLAKNQAGFQFSVTGGLSGGPAGARAIDFVESQPKGVTVKWSTDCFEAQGGGQEGRLWFDPQTFDVLRLDVRASKPFLIPDSSGFFGLQRGIRLERHEFAMRFARVTFENPDETVLLPESIETLTVFRGPPSLRTTQKLSNFRRFLSEARIRSSHR